MTRIHQNPLERVVDQPQEGFFELRLVRRGYPVPARIHKEDGRWVATINGQQMNGHPDPVLAERVLDIWHHAAPISESDYNYKLQLAKAAAIVRPDHPAANPNKSINLNILPPVYKRRG